MDLTSSLETERKYDVDDTAIVPDLNDLGQGQTSEPVTLRAVYYDTADGVLAAHLITLRRRTGGKDEGWHLKTPAEGGRTEYHAPLESAAAAGSATVSPPASILDPVRGLLRRRPVVEIARLNTQRTLTVLRSPDGAELAEIADDTVSATDVHTGILRIWREWEVELLAGAPDSHQLRDSLLDSVEKKLLAAGAVPSSSASKLARATGRTNLAADAVSHARSGPVSSSSSALEVVSAVLADLLQKLVAADPLVRRDEPDAVHSMRIVVRRLRSVLAASNEVLDPSVTNGVRQGLRQLGDVLGGARDTEVRRQRAIDALAAQADSATSTAESPNLQPDATVQRRLVDDALGEYGAHYGELTGFLSSDSYFDLLDELDMLVARPPVARRSLEPAKKVLRTALGREGKRARKRLKAAVASGRVHSGVPVDTDALEALHNARKAVRRLRYVAEALSGDGVALFGTKTAAVGLAAKQLQDVIGDHRDATLFIDHLDVLSREAVDAGENAAGYGTLAERERHNARTALSGLKKSIRALKAASNA